MVHSVPSSKLMTGSSSRMAAFSRPLASYGLLGAMIFRPGLAMNRASGRSLCCAALEPP